MLLCKKEEAILLCRFGGAPRQLKIKPVGSESHQLTLPTGECCKVPRKVSGFLPVPGALPTRPNDHPIFF